MSGFVPAIRIEHVSKLYRLGVLGSGTLREDLARWWARVRGRPDTIGFVEDPSDPHSRHDDEIWALRDIDLEVREGEVLGFVGHNGAGKSTLLRILSHITAPTSGRVLIRGRVASLLEVGTGMHPELTGRENVFLNGAILGMTRREIAGKLDEIVEFSGVAKFIDTPVKRYSSGMRVRLAFAVAAHLEPEILIVDEVLAVGDDAFQRKCLGKMRDVSQQGRTVLFVSHNMSAIQRLCTRVAWLQHGEVVDVGDTTSVVERYLASMTVESRTDQSLAPGVLYQASPSEGPQDAVRRLELLDVEGERVPHCRTGTPFRIRIEFEAAYRYPSFGVEFSIRHRDGTTLVRSSTAPDQTVKFGVEPGRHRIECDFLDLPVAAGEYLLGAALTIPGTRYVWREDSLATLLVRTRDVYDSGFPPSADRYLVVTPHRWRAPERVNAASEVRGT